jgi:hypothetical protein
VEILQNRIDDLIGFNGSKILVFGENKEGRALGRFKILNVFTAETINIHHLLDTVIKKTAQDPGVDRDNVDIEPNVAYNFANKSDSLEYDLTLDVSSLKVDAIKIRVGASQHIQPPVPAVAVELDVEGECDLNLGSFNLVSVSVNNNRITLEVGAKLDDSGKVATVAWVNDDPFNVDINWEAALAAGLITGGLFLLGLDGLKDYVVHEVNDKLIDGFRSFIEEAIFQTPFIMSTVLVQRFIDFQSVYLVS